ncbi:MAG: 3-hydroxyisobutyrate dehydrogenase [Ponticaulis sp.]|nr:3-hydroxyisobutyrate dehydrogenase [Ponticaulis sp.]|tara:strand:+ start:123285 stop:124151 length:867 start_codon:yes stop_codon:yes gene_type:complete
MKIGFIGLGAMGSRIAVNLLAAGHDLAVWNRTPMAADDLVEKGARFAANPRDCASGAEFVMSCVRDDQASRSIWLEGETAAIHGLSPNAIAIESSTLTIDWTKQLGNAFAEKGLAFLDAPVLGSRPQAEGKTLIHVVGGDEAVFTRAQPVLADMGGAQHLMGPVGTGAAMKLMVNAMMGVQVTALAELLAATEKDGISKARAADVFGSTIVCSPQMKIVSGLMAQGNHAPLFPVELIEKDLGYAVKEAGGAQALPVTSAARDVFTSAVTVGDGDLNMSAVAKLYVSVS